MKKINKVFYMEYIVPLVLLIFLTAMYFCVPIIVMPDSTEYYDYLKIFYGISPLADWNVVRGFSLPLILFISTKIFGNNSFGLLTGTFMFYLGFNVIFYAFYKKILKKISSKNKKIVVSLLYYILILFNPLLFGYFHGLLTEFVAIALALFASLLAYKFLQSKLNFKLINSYLYLIIYILLFIFCWFLKQPYFTIALFPLVIVTIISIFKYKSIKDFCIRIGILCISSFVLLFTIASWKNLLIKAGVDYKNGRNNEHFLKEAVFNGISNFRFEKDDNKYLLENIDTDKLISMKDKELIKNRNNKNYKIINVYNNNKEIIDKMIFYYDGNDYNSSEAFNFLFKSLKKHPIYVLNSYANGYLATIDIYISQRDELGYYFPERTIMRQFNHENKSIGESYLWLDNNFYWLGDYNSKRVENLYTEFSISKNIKDFIMHYSNIHFISFKLLFLILPFMLLILLYLYLFKKVRNKNMELAIIVFGFAFTHTIFHVVTGAIIDRYVYIVFPEIIIVCMALFTRNNEEKLVLKGEVVMSDNIKLKKKNKKSIFVIPAYNESMHIENVIKDIKKNMSHSDIVVINDCSKDNTREIVENLGITCLNLPFNMGYAMAVQTGIKYAYENGYDYVIQFDADGQHLSSEVKKLFKQIDKTNANIIIGSRFLEKTDYKHPFFRKIGTKMFSIIIKIFCKKTITDPTSGFQLLDRSVIERYSKMGNYPEFPDANLIIEMLLLGYNIEEVSVKMRECDDGVSMHGGIIKPIKYMINVTYTIVFILIRGSKFRGGK